MKHDLTVKVRFSPRRIHYSNTHSKRMKASHTVERNVFDLPTGNLPAVAGAHVHTGKKIEDGFPVGGYGTPVPPSHGPRP